MNDILNAALSYAAQGFSVIPIIPKDKRPLMAWEDHQGRKAIDEEIKAWWSEWPEANVGIVTGKISGVIVVDLDSVGAKDKFKELIPDYDLTAVPRSRTGKGWQLFFKHPMVTVANRAGIIPGLDVRGDGGYVVAPPSIHPSGRQYKWEVPINGELPKLPVELFKLISSLANGTTKGPAQAIQDNIFEGERNAALTSLAGTMRRRGMSEASILAALQEENGARCNPPLPVQEVAAIAKSVARYPAATEPKHREENTNKGEEFVSAPIENKPCAINFTLQTWSDFLNIDFAEHPYTIEGLAPDSGLVAFHGRGKDGKTTFLIHACRAIASGQPFLTKATLKKPIIYLNYEMGFSYLQKLLGAAGACPEEAYIINRPEPVLQIATVEAIIEQVNKPGLLVIDSFRGAFRLQGDAENSSGGAGLILRKLQDIAVKHKWLVVVVHHRNRSAKDGTDSISGTSDWIAAPDVIWTWTRPDKTKPGTLSVEGRMPPVDPLAVQLSPEECVFMGSLEESREENDKATIMAVLTEDGQEATDIEEAVKLPVSTVRKRLESMFKGGLIARDGEGKRGSPFLYSKINCAQNILLREETKCNPPLASLRDKECGWEDLP